MQSYESNNYIGGFYGFHSSKFSIKFIRILQIFYKILKIINHKLNWRTSTHHGLSDSDIEMPLSASNKRTALHANTCQFCG